jgi:hypothetical protein
VKSAAGALHLGIFEQPYKNGFFSKLLNETAQLIDPYRKEGGE